MEDYNTCLKKMVDVIRIADAQHKAGVMSALDLKAEAQRGSIFPYSKVGKPQAAVSFFKKYVPKTYLKVSTKLAEALHRADGVPKIINGSSFAR